jgi:hypothetical protein
MSDLRDYYDASYPPEVYDPPIIPVKTKTKGRTTEQQETTTATSPAEPEELV